jgi:mono/diheme cytochrome c family protein
VFTVLALACRQDGPGSTAPGTETGAPSDSETYPPLPVQTDPLAELPTGAEQWKLLCARGYADSVSRAFCEGDAPPDLGSFAELRTFLGLGGDLLGGDSPLRATAVFHSTAVSSRFVTPLNPRAFLLTRPKGVVNPVEPQPDEAYTVLAFSRGEAFVELASKDAETEEPRFFLLRFALPCEGGGCTAADLLTPAIESGWTGTTLYADEDVANTTLDCLRCHQPDGPGTARLLLMQELRNPWNHWFYEELDGNIGAIRAFEAAHGTSRYADLPANLYTDTRPSNLQALVQNNTGLDQPNEYPSATINEELEATGTSATWQALFAGSLVADHKPVPYAGNPHVEGNWDYSVPYDPTLDPHSPVAAAIEAYVDLAAGMLPPEQMPELADLWLPAALEATSFHAQAGLDGEGLLRQTCGQCHNSRLDPTLTRARFNVDTLSDATRAEKDEAISRLLLADEDVLKMPPPRFHALTEDERDAMISFLSD